MEQIPRYLDTDGIEKERHVYSGPQGSGYLDYEYKTVDGVNYIKCTHVGPENRESYDWRILGE